jgi:hypothetical protein
VAGGSPGVSNLLSRGFDQGFVADPQPPLYIQSEARQDIPFHLHPVSKASRIARLGSWSCRFTINWERLSPVGALASPLTWRSYRAFEVAGVDLAPTPVRRRRA